MMSTSRPSCGRRQRNLKIVGEDPSSGGRPGLLASLEFLRGYTSEFLVEDGAPRIDR